MDISKKAPETTAADVEKAEQLPDDANGENKSHQGDEGGRQQGMNGANDGGINNTESNSEEWRT